MVINQISIYFSLLVIGFFPSNLYADQIQILALGNSLTAGYGVEDIDNFTNQLERALLKNGLSVEITNAGVSGDTSAGGRARLSWTLKDKKPDLVIVELGGNDALRGINPKTTLGNIEFIIVELKRRNIEIVLTGMKAPPNMGSAYVGSFNSIYPYLAQKYKLHFYPFFLEGVAARKELNQNDGIHPNAAGINKIVRLIKPLILHALGK